MDKKRMLGEISFTLFIILIVLVRFVNVAEIGPAGTSVGLSSLNAAVHGFFGVNAVWCEVSEICGYLAIAVVGFFAAVGVLQLARRKSIREVDSEIFALGGLYVLMFVFYALFDVIAVTYRPVLEEGQAFPESSFPSSHTMLACVVFWSAVTMLDRYVKDDRLRRAGKAVCIVLSVVTTAARLASGVHWFTDILGGILISVGLVQSFSSIINYIGGKKNAGSI